MAIFCCDDPDAYGKRAKRDRRAHRERHDARALSRRATASRDCRAAFIEFNHTDGGDDVLGPYPPAGPDWQNAIRKDVTQALVGVEMQSPDPKGLAEHWGGIIGVEASTNDRGEAELKLPNADFRFVEGDSEIMSGLMFRVRDVGAVHDAAKVKGYTVSDDSFSLAGVVFHLTA